MDYEELYRQNKLNKIWTNDAILRLKMYDKYRNKDISILNDKHFIKKLNKYENDMKMFKKRYNNIKY
tara:strand:+ start:754 stop:954 length:201 start_codon:yes stop_codon:yes gene_type:complete